MGSQGGGGARGGGVARGGEFFCWEGLLRGGVENFCWGGPTGVMALCGRVTLEWG